MPLKPSSRRLWRVLAPLLALSAGAVAALWGAPAQAKCAHDAFWVWPPAEVALPSNGVILLTGYGASQGAISAVADLKPALAVEGGPSGAVPLEVVEVRSGGAGETKVMLRPVRPLSPGHMYALTFGEAPPERWREPQSKARWSVSGGPDTAAPAWSGPLAVSGAERVAYGCGPGVTVTLAAPVTDDAPARPLLFDVTLTADDGGTERMWVEVTSPSGSIGIGHGMCSGEFSMVAPRYTATVTALDLAGNAAPALGPVTFDTP